MTEVTTTASDATGSIYDKVKDTINAAAGSLTDLAKALVELNLEITPLYSEVLTQVNLQLGTASPATQEEITREVTVVTSQVQVAVEGLLAMAQAIETSLMSTEIPTTPE